MVPVQRRTLTIILLSVYWPAITVLTAMPIPLLVRRAHVSDKFLHFLAFLILAFLLWFSIRPNKKVNWRKATVWLVLLVAAAYGAADELLQKYLAGRSCDAMDFAANMAGVLAGLVLFSFLTFTPALLVVTGAAIFLLSNLARVNPAELLPVTNALFHPFAYGLFSLVWMYCMRLHLSLKAPKVSWLTAALALPMIFLLVVRLFSLILGRDFSRRDVIMSAVGIVAAVITVYTVSLFRRPQDSELKCGS